MARVSRLTGGGKVGALMRSHDWSQTPLSSMETWPPSFFTALSIVLNSPCPMFVLWGIDPIVFYNDACLPLLGDKHPNILGKRAKDCWAEVWPEIGSDFEQVLTTGQPIHRQQVKGFLNCNSPLAKHSFTLSYSAIADERGMVGGILTVVVDEVSVLADKIPQCRQAEMALQENEAQFKLALEVTRTVYWERDLKTDQLILSSNFTEPTTSQIIPYQDALTLVHPEDRETVRQANETAIANCSSFEFEHRLMEPQDRQWRWVLARGKVLTDASGNPTRIVGVSIDISDRQRLEKERQQIEIALRESEERFRVSQELSLDAFTILQSVRNQTGEIVDFEWTYVNPKAAQILQRPIAELIGHRLLEVLPTNKANSDLFDRYVKVVETGEPHDIELFYEGEGISGWFRNMTVKLKDGVAISFSDITARKHTEKALRQSEERLRIALKNSPMSVFNQDRDLRYTWIYNPAFDHQVDEVIGKLDSDLLSSEDAAVLTRIKSHVLETGIGVRAEVKLTMNGQEYYYDLTVEPLQDDRNNIIGVTCAAVDISDRKQVEMALRRSETVLSAFLASSPVGMAFLDHDLRYIYANEALAAINGLPLSEHLNRTVWEVLPAWAAQIQAVAQQVMQTKEPLLNREVSGVTNPPGVYRSALVNHFPVCLPDGQVIGVGVTSMDITARKQAEEALRQSEERLRLAVTAGRMVAWTWDASTDAIARSESACDILGLTPESFNSTGTDGWGLVHPEDRAMHQARVEAAIVNRGNYISEVRMIRPDNGATIWVEDRGQVRYNEQGNLLSIEGILFDITARKRAEEALRESEQRLQLAQQSAKIGTWEWNLVTHQVTWSDGIWNLLAIEPGSITPSLESFFHFIHPDDLLLTRQHLEAVIAQGEDFYDEFRIIRHDGIVCWLVSKGRIIRTQDGQAERLIGINIDISDRKQAEEALRLSENRYRTLANAVPQLMWMSAADGTAQFFNQPWVEYTGIPLELGLQIWTQIIHPEDAQSVLALRNCAIQAGEAYEMKVRLKRFDQTYRWHLARVVPLKDENGQVIQWFGTATDIHNVKQTEVALRESSAIAKARAEELEALMEITPAALWIAQDPNCHHMTANQTAYKLMRAEPGSVATSTPPDGSYPLQFKQRRNGQDISPEDLPMQRAARTGQEVTDELEFVFEDGTVRFIYGKAVPLWNEAGSVRGVIAAFVDISERKQAEELLRQSEERLRLAMEGAQMGTWDVDLLTGKAIWSERHFSMLGYEPVPTGEATEEMWNSRIHPHDLEYVSQEWQQSRQERRLYRSEYRVIRADNQQIAWLAAFGSFTYDQNGQAIRSIGVLFDITERKQAEQEREQLLERERAAREEAQAANRIKDEFLAVLSHELRSPLNPILGWSKLLQTRQFDLPATKRALETIERNAKLQTQLIDDLLDVSRILRGKLALNVCPVDLVTVIEAALETVQLSAQAKNILVQKELPRDIGLISGDSGRLQQIVWNLLSNAVKFTPSGGRIEIRLSRVGTDAQIQVQDTGKGITPEFLPYVFEYFRQEDGKTTRQFGGLGLGLAIVRYLTELHGGTVRAESPGEGRGATFTVRFPLLKGQKKPTENNTISLPLASLDSILSGLRILIVDDEADMRELIFTILKPTGAAIRVARSATEALAGWDSFQPDIIVCDIGMPHIDGYGLMRQVRRLPPFKRGRIPAIALTAYAGEVDRQQALTAGFQMHIAKPVEPEQLVKAIVDLTAKHTGLTQRL